MIRLNVAPLGAADAALDHLLEASGIGGAITAFGGCCGGDRSGGDLGDINNLDAAFNCCEHVLEAFATARVVKPFGVCASDESNGGDGGYCGICGEDARGVALPCAFAGENLLEDFTAVSVVGCFGVCGGSGSEACEAGDAGAPRDPGVQGVGSCCVEAHHHS